MSPAFARPRPGAWLAAAAVLLAGRLASAAPCDDSCDVVLHELPSCQGATWCVSGEGVSPGATVCLDAAASPVKDLTVTGFAGTAEAPITVRSCGGTFRIEGGDSGQALLVRESQHVRLSGGEGAERGWRIQGAKPASTYVMGVAFIGCSQGITLDHFEISGTSYTALRNHHDSPACPVRRGFVVRDNYLHDVGGEGMFLGINDDQSPYQLDDVVVADNLVVRPGYQGIKLGMVQNGRIERNVVIEAGAAQTDGEDTGLALGPRMNLVVRDNV
ncbi:MAG: hypothetical protein EOO75_11160, partial [Myxococcales bacterium]